MQGEASARPGGRAAARLRAGFRQALFAVAVILLQVLPAAAQQAAPRPADTAAAATSLMPEDIEAALAQMEALGRFFGAFADRDTNGFAQERWRRLSLGYPGTAAILRDLLSRGILLIDDLPQGRSSGLLDRGEIVLDRDLDGRWRPGLPQSGGNGAAVAAQRLHLLLPVLIEALARRQAPQDWPWLADHLRAVGGFGQLAQDPVARPFLARFFQAKDGYLWLAMQRIAAGDPAVRQELAARQVETFNAIRGLATDMAATFGLEPAERLQRDWSEYVAQVDGFAVTRGWLLLDPALRRTQFGAAAQREADAVNQAAAEVVASAPRSALAAARTDAARSAAPEVPTPQAAVPALNLGTVVAQTQGRDPDALAGELPSPALAQQPEASAALNAAAFRAFAARIKEAAAQRDQQLIIADREQQLGVARDQVASLQSEVGALAAALEERAAEAERLEVALAAERARLAAVEQRAAVQTADAERRLAEAEALMAEERAAGQRAALEQAAAPVPQIAVVPPAVVDDDRGSALPRIEQRQLYLIAAIALVFLLALWLWLRGRRRVAAVAQPPQRLVAMPAGEEAAASLPQRPIIEVAEEIPLAAAAEPAATAAPRTSRHPGRPLRVSGVTPPSAEAKAAMKAGSVRREAQRSTGQAAGPAALGREADAAAHPIVEALRQGNLPLFEMLFSELTELRSPQLQRIVYGGRGEDLAIVCRAVGIDKLLFGSIFLLTDPLRGGDAEEDPERTAEILRMYDRMPPATAQKVLAKWQRNWSGAGRRPSSADA
ncbi:MAG: DUF2336 domain-containing protein [Kiloniellaceae bacterium]